MCAAAPALAAAQSGLAAKLDVQRSRERALAGHVAAFSDLIARLDGDITVLGRRERVLQAGLDAQRRELERTQRVLRRERARLAALRARLAYSRGVLSQRLVSTYKTGRPDLVTVVLTSRGWVDLLERGEFLERINRQDRVVITQVRSMRDEVQLATDRLALLEARQQQIAQAILVQRDQVASTRLALDRKRAGAAAARADVRLALGRTSANRSRLEGQLARLQAQNPGAGLLGALAGWAIPWRIVNCESGGRNWGPNGAGASGYYQIIPSTWRGFGGRGPAAYLAPKSEQDRIAARIFRGGAGAGNWVCAGR